MKIRPWLWLTVLFWGALQIAFSPTRIQSDSQDSQHLDITLELKTNGDWQSIDPGRVLDQGNQVRFRVDVDHEYPDRTFG